MPFGAVFAFNGIQTSKRLIDEKRDSSVEIAELINLDFQALDAYLTRLSSRQHALELILCQMIRHEPHSSAVLLTLESDGMRRSTRSA